MQIERLTEIERKKLKEFKLPYRNTMTMVLTMIGFLSLFIAGIYLIGIFEDRLVFKNLKIHWTFPLVFLLITFLWYLVKVKPIYSALNRGTKITEEFTVESKGSEKYGTYSTGNYLASGSSDRFYLNLGDSKYYCSKKEFDTFKSGDKVKVAVSQESKFIISIEMPVPNNLE